MRRILTVLTCLILLPMPALALEITPMGGYRFGGQVATAAGEKLTFDESGSFALAVDFDFQHNKQIELFWSHQQTALSQNGATVFNTGIDCIQIGGTVLYPQKGFTPYVAGGLGVTHFSPGSDYKPETRFSLSVGGGIKTFITKHIGLRLEGRGYATWFPDEGYIFCGGGGCNIAVSGDAIFQFEGLAGAIFLF